MATDEYQACNHQIFALTIGEVAMHRGENLRSRHQQATEISGFCTSAIADVRGADMLKGKIVVLSRGDCEGDVVAETFDLRAGDGPDRRPDRGKTPLDLPELPNPAVTDAEKRRRGEADAWWAL